jgi:hypothetical protein
MKNETIEDIDKQANDVIGIYEGLGWMTSSLDPSLFEYFWLDTSDGHFISKLRAHLSALDKDINDHFPIDKKEWLKQAVNDFIEVNSYYLEANIPETKWYLKPERLLEKKWYLYQLRQKGKMAFIRTIDILANCKPKKD